MSSSDSWNLLVFRDGRRVHNGPNLVAALRQTLNGLFSSSDFTHSSTQERLIEALLRSGELECALADHPAGSGATGRLARTTDQLANALAGKPNFNPSPILTDLNAQDVPEHLSVSVPEGFCYYALHPHDYLDLLNENSLDAPAAAVVGIRSIGVTLSAVVRAWFDSRGIPAERITVRPTGHPFDRTLPLSDRERRWIANGLQRRALFLVVDEGPGLSGSSFLAVAEALVQAGVPQHQIVLLPSSEPDLSSLLAPDAAARWRRFNTIALKGTRHIPAEATFDIGCGAWRSKVFAHEDEWPGVWIWTERRKFLSSDKRCILRFDGYGHYGTAVRNRTQLIAEHGWGPQPSPAGHGFTSCAWMSGERQTIANRDTVLQLARYCAFRAAHFETTRASTSALEEMTQINLERALNISHSVVLPIERPVIPDARMMSHEWILTQNGRLFKVDASTHGDDHFYPGATDIAWDLAGVIIEWNLDHEASGLLIREYERISGDSIQARLPAYLVAYCAFRLGFTLSAERSAGDTKESARFSREANIYRKRLGSLLPLATALKKAFA